MADRAGEIIAAEGLPRIDKGGTPTIAKMLAGDCLIALFGLSGVFSGLVMMAISPFIGFLVLLSSIGGGGAIVFSRIVAESILIIFRINGHLRAIRDRAGCGRA